MGMGAAYMKGCRRPKRDRVRSEIEPITGSANPSKTKESEMASPPSQPGSPSTWL
jgi:hypothetical protein